MRTIWKVLIGLLVLLIVVRISLPFWIENYVNKTLHKLDEYDGHVEDIDLSFIRGHYMAKGLEIHKIGQDTLTPFVQVKEIDVGISWGALLKGKIVSTIAIIEPQVHYVANVEQKEAPQQSGGKNDWRQTIKDMTPLEIDRFELSDGTITYKDYSTSPDVDLTIDSLYIIAENLTNIEAPNDSFPAKAHLACRTTGNGHLDIKTDMNLLTPVPNVRMNLRYKHVNLTAFNDFVQAYANFDLEKGYLYVYSEAQAYGGNIQGYVKPFFNEVVILNWQKDKQEKGFFNAVWESIAGLFAESTENQKKDQTASRVPFAMKMKKNDVDVSAALLNLVRHAFIKALNMEIDNQAQVQGENTDRIILQSSQK